METPDLNERLLSYWEEHLANAERAVVYAHEQIAHYAGLIALVEIEPEQ